MSSRLHLLNTLAMIAAISSMLINGPQLARAQAPSCLVGEWHVSDPAGFFAAAFTTSAPAEIDSVDGDITLAISADGDYQLNFVALTVVLTAQDTSGTIVMEGTIRGRIRETEPGVVIGSLTDSAVTATTTVSGATSSRNVPYEPHEETGPLVSYDCERGQLSFLRPHPGDAQGVSLSFVRR